MEKKEKKWTKLKFQNINLMWLHTGTASLFSVNHLNIVSQRDKIETLYKR